MRATAIRRPVTATDTDAMPNDDYKTTDINAVAFLLTKGHRLRRIEGGEWRIFVFPSSAAADGAAYHQDAPVPVRSFLRRLRDARALLHHT